MGQTLKNAYKSGKYIGHQTGKPRTDAEKTKN